MRPESAMGIDASKRGLGLAVAPLDWDRDPKRVVSITLSVPLHDDATEEQQVERLRMLALDVRTVAIRYNVRHAFIESYSFGQRHGAHHAGEITAAIKLELWRECGLCVRTANQSSAQVFVYGCAVPRQIGGKKATDAARKRWLLEPLRAAGFSLEDHNQGDAVRTLLYGFEMMGIPSMKWLLGTPEHFAALAKEKARERARAKRSKAA